MCENDVSSDDERNGVNINDCEREVLASSNKSDEDREVGLDGNSFVDDDVEDGKECSGTEVFDNELCSDSSMELSNSIDGIPQQPDFGKLPKKLSNTTDYLKFK